ncbi:sulfate transporter CysZ [uncultured Psychromonas sp.]|uniref:sulfate transporter CysZ n=1 Tax=uncultured Psychromonas sp. TaxID=173974 RepID=UPI0026060394|nr:sulfate transporter CysZ [uncultured Psychromonas sp.]
MNSKNIIDQPLSGLGYLLKGIQLLSHPQLRIFVLIPLLINVFIFASAFWFLFSSITAWIETYMQELPTFLSWLSYILWPIIIFTILFSFSFIFSTIANLIAAPFNGLLAEKTEILLTNAQINDDGWQDIFKDLPRILKRECQKWVYFLPRMLGCLILFFVPVIGQTIAPIVWFIFAGWMMAIQYADYPFDNHKVSFITMRKTLATRFGKNITFGMIISFCTTIPLVNFIIMPIAVCGATAAWVDIYKREVLENPLNRIE